MSRDTFEAQMLCEQCTGTNETLHGRYDYGYNDRHVHGREGTMHSQWMSLRQATRDARRYAIEYETVQLQGEANNG